MFSLKKFVSLSFPSKLLIFLELKMFDCIIVGAGPAGATAAYHLAKQKKSVLGS